QAIHLLLYGILGSCSCLGCLSWLPLWRVERHGGHLAEMAFGSFWQFLGNLPSAVRYLCAPQDPELVLMRLPTAHFWANVWTTLIVMAVGAVAGLIVWYVHKVFRLKGGAVR